MDDATTSVTSTEDIDGTTDDSDSVDTDGTTPSESPDERTASAASDGEELFKADLDSVPEALRPHVEKYVKQIEKDWKVHYTRKTQDLSAREKMWTQEKTQYETKLEEAKRVALEVLQDPTNAKLDAYRKIYGFSAESQVEPEIPPEIQTVGDLQKWNREQIAREVAKATKEVKEEALSTLKRTKAVERWESGINVMAKDQTNGAHFTRYQQFIIDIAKSDPEVRGLYRGNNEVEVLAAAQNKFRDLIRPDMEQIKDNTLKSQKKKKTVVTAEPSKTLPMVAQAAKTQEEVIARVRAKLGPPSASESVF